MSHPKTFHRTAVIMLYQRDEETIVSEGADHLIVCDTRHHTKLTRYGREPHGACICQGSIIKAICEGLTNDGLYNAIADAMGRGA